MENNSDRMGFALIALSVVAFVLLAVNGPLKSTVDGFFNGFNNMQAGVIDDVDNAFNQKVTHTAYSWSSDGTDRFTTTKPNLNLLDGTSSSFTTVSANGWGTPNSLTTNSIDFKKGQSYTYSAWIQDCDVDTRAVIYLFDSTGYYPYVGTTVKAGESGFSFVTFTVSVDVVRYESSIGFIESQSDYHNLSYSKPKLEQGSIATPYMPSASEVKPSDQPKYIGTYTDKTDSASQDPTKYTWKVNPEYHA